MPSLVFLSFGFVIALNSYRLGLGSLQVPGPGLAPFLLGVLLVFSSIPVVLGSLRALSTHSHSIDTKIWREVNVKKIAIILAVLVGYALFLERLGFITTTLFCMITLFRIVEKHKWSAVLLATFLTVFSSYLLFVTILKVELPVRIFWIF